MGFWEKSHRIFKCLCDHGRQGVRRIAQQTGLSKSSVHRLTQAMERRNSHPDSWFWETADGRQWLMRLVVATLYTFGLKRGVGLDTRSELFTRLHLETQVGCSALITASATLHPFSLSHGSSRRTEGHRGDLD
jgi:DNA-binding IclR family transcriptional regulator